MHAPLAAQRRCADGPEALALDLGATLGDEPRLRVVQDIRRRHGRAVEDRAAHGAAAHGNGARARVLVGETAGRAQHGEGGGVTVPGHHQRGVGGHHLERAVHDRVERLVEIEGGRQRLADRLQRAHEHRAAPALGDHGVKADDAADGAASVTPGHVARDDPAAPRVPGELVADVAGRGGLAGERPGEMRGHVDVTQEVEHLGRGLAQRGVARDPGQMLHHAVPCHHGQRGIGHDDRVFEALDQARAQRIQARSV